MACFPGASRGPRLDGRSGGDIPAFAGTASCGEVSCPAGRQRRWGTNKSKRPLPVVRRSSGRSFATDGCFRLWRKRAHSVGLASPPASGGDANYGTSRRASTSPIRRSPLRLHESNSPRLGECLVHPSSANDPIHAGASRSTMSRCWPCWSRALQAPALRRPAVARWRCRPACG